MTIRVSVVSFASLILCMLQSWMPVMLARCSELIPIPGCVETVLDSTWELNTIYDSDDGLTVLPSTFDISAHTDHYFKIPLNT